MALTVVINSAPLPNEWYTVASAKPKKRNRSVKVLPARSDSASKSINLLVIYGNKVREQEKKIKIYVMPSKVMSHKCSVSKRVDKSTQTDGSELHNLAKRSIPQF